MPVNKVLELDLSWVDSVLDIQEEDINTALDSSDCLNKAVISEHLTLRWLLNAINAVDLAALVGNETPEDVNKLCKQAAFPLEETCPSLVSKIPKMSEGIKMHCATVCIYPLRVDDAVKALAKLNVNNHICVAAVAAGFPSGQYPLHTRLAEISYVVENGAREVDVVIDRSLVLRGLWAQLYDELVQMRKASGDTKLKVILSVTECGSMTNIYKASVIAMLAGADFIKTSTGKEARSVALKEGYVMCLAIKDFYKRKNIKVGLKPAGGIRSADDAVSWMLMVKNVLSEDWLHPDLFRIGTSGSSTMMSSVFEALAKL